MFAMSFFFRDPFKYIPTLKDHFHSIPLMALTATATPEVKEKIVEMLRNPICHLASVNKPNIYYSVQQLNTGMSGSYGHTNM